MAGRKRKFPSISPDQAHAALRWLHALGKVTAKDIANAVTHRERLVAEIKKKLEQLGGEGLRFLRGPASFKKRAPRLKTKRASAAARAAWKTQGRYLGAVRPLSKANRAKVKAIRAKSGVRAAMIAAKKLAR